MTRQVVIVFSQEDDVPVLAKFVVEPRIPFEDRGATQLEQIARRALNASGASAYEAASHKDLGWALYTAFEEQIKATLRESDKVALLLAVNHGEEK